MVSQLDDGISTLLAATPSGSKMPMESPVPALQSANCLLVTSWQLSSYAELAHEVCGLEPVHDLETNLGLLDWGSRRHMPCSCHACMKTWPQQKQALSIVWRSILLRGEQGKPHALSMRLCSVPGSRLISEPQARPDSTLALACVLCGRHFDAARAGQQCQPCCSCLSQNSHKGMLLWHSLALDTLAVS